MKSAKEWFEEGLAAVARSVTTDYGSDYRDDLQRAVAAFDQAR